MITLRLLVEYESGVQGVIETGFVAHGSPFQLELYGTEGTLMIEDQAIRINSRQLGQGWQELEEIVPSLPMPLEQWVTSIINNTVPSLTKEDVINLTLINEAAALSHAQGKRINVKEITETVKSK